MIIVTGSLAYDNILDFPGKFADHILPDQIHKINLSFIAQGHAKRRGGTAGNLVYSLQLLNTPSILFSRAGKDFIEYQTVFNTMGIDTSRVEIDEMDNTSTGFAITDNSNNQIWGYSYGAGRAEKMIKLKLSKVATKNDLIVVGPCSAPGTMGFVKQAIKYKFPYLFDPSFVLADVTNDELELGITHCKILIGNDYEMELMKKRIKNFSELVKDKLVITTLGEKGTLMNDRGEKYMVGIVSVKKIIDPTGAGDAWRAGFLAGYEREYDLMTCGQMGATAASFAIEKYGTQEHTFTISEFKKRYRQTFGSLVKLDLPNG